MVPGPKAVFSGDGGVGRKHAPPDSISGMTGPQGNGRKTRRKPGKTVLLRAEKRYSAAEEDAGAAAGGVEEATGTAADGVSAGSC